MVAERDPAVPDCEAGRNEEARVAPGGPAPRIAKWTGRRAGRAIDLNQQYDPCI